MVGLLVVYNALAFFAHSHYHLHSRRPRHSAVVDPQPSLRSSPPSTGPARHGRRCSALPPPPRTQEQAQPKPLASPLPPRVHSVPAPFLVISVPVSDPSLKSCLAVGDTLYDLFLHSFSSHAHRARCPRRLRLRHRRHGAL